MSQRERVQAHVVHRNGCWQLDLTNGTPPTRDEAIAKADKRCRELHQTRGMNIELIIQDIDGNVLETRVYEGEPETATDSEPAATE